MPKQSEILFRRMLYGEVTPTEFIKEARRELRSKQERLASLRARRRIT